MCKIFLILLIIIAPLGVVFSQSDYDLNTEVYPKIGADCSTPLDKATCAGGNQRKAYIEALKEAGVSKEEIFLKVAKKFSLDAILDKQLKGDIEAQLTKGLSPDRPIIFVESARFDFGGVSRSQDKVFHIFKIQNKGKTDLIISNIYSACACTSASLKVGDEKSRFFNTGGADKGWQAVIRPGMFGELGVVLELTHKNVQTGPLERKTFILSNDPIYSNMSVAIIAQVKD
jgi:hypothetical protein